MRFILIGLVFYLLVEAYYAVQRVIRKRQLGQGSGQKPAQTRFDAAQSGSSSQPQMIDAPTASTPETQIADFAAQDIPLPDPASSPVQEISEPIVDEAAPSSSAAEFSAPATAVPEIPEPAAPQTSGDAASPAETASEPASDSPALPIGSPVVLDSDKDLTLAVSLSVTDIVHPSASGAVEVPDLIPTDPAISEVLNANAEPTHAHHPSILEEIAELRPIADADPTSRFMHALQTGDGTVRVAAVYELGEIATRRHGSEAQAIIEQLQMLTQDEDPDVRLQAIAALAKVQR